MNTGSDCCGPNEAVYSPTPACPYTCQNLHQIHCFAIIGEASCQCTNGTIRDTASGKCVPQSRCPKITTHECPANQTYAQTMSACPPTCTNPNGPICDAIIDKAGCVCISETVRDTVNNAVSSPTPACPYTCQNLHHIHCFALEDVASCQCITGTIRDTTSGQCVPQSQCPKLTTQPTCPANQIYAQTMSACPPTCANPNGPLCQAIIVKPGCVCIPGTVRETTNNVCIKPGDCPK
ncbi:unnamed protein product [Oppiella nova]|uniref:TIL domain-containing protein n=1 Tax=Oppiella nova TaxID=334625 RepID=A0A7R9QSK7_9ACAR|nr:unnamed protein product [Oppiella nova]CAG2173864.1 unnamed protein product [Oppiella nova]